MQRRIVEACQLNGTPVIVATHMLESMIENPMPTRAEITDVSNAVYEQADAIMLSGETSVGQYPLQCIEVMDRIARRTEGAENVGFVAHAKMNTTSGRLMKSASVLAQEIEASAILVFTETGGMARSAAWQRNPHCPVFAFAENMVLRNQLMLLWGVEPFFLELNESNPMANVDSAIEFLLGKGLLSSGDEVVSVTEVVHNGKVVDSIQMETVS